MNERKITVLKRITKDMKDDATNFEGKEFNGKNVAVYLGNLGAAVAALADIVKSGLEKDEH